MSAQQNGIVQIVKSLLGIFFNEEGKLNRQKLYVGLFLLLLTMGYMHREGVSEMVKSFNYTKSYDAYLKSAADEKFKNYDAAIKNQARSIYTNIFPDMVGIYIYEPEDLHHFKNMVHYEGVLPNNGKPEDYKNLGVDKTSPEYHMHILGIPYHSNYNTIYGNTPIDENSPYNYTCPIFNSRNVYIGTVEMNWNKMPEMILKDKVSVDRKLFVACTSAARQIGIYK